MPSDPEPPLTKRVSGNNYWRKLYDLDKRLFLLIFSFFFLSILSNLIRLQTTPFFIWSFYSQKIPPQTTYSFYELSTDGGRVIRLEHSWEQPAALLVYGSLEYYSTVRLEKGGVDPVGDYLNNQWGKRHPVFRPLLPVLYPRPDQFDHFPGWYKGYISQLTGTAIQNLFILKKTVRYTPSGLLEEIASDTALVIH